MDEYSLTLKYEKLIYKIARKFYNVELDDLYQAGCIGLIKAYRNYDETSPVPFMNYAYKYIFGEMYDLANKSRDIKLNKAYLKLYKRIEEAKMMLANKIGRMPSSSEICSYLEIDSNLYAEVISLTSKMMSLDDEYQTLNGEQALVYARNRKALVNGDFGRNQHQQEIVMALANKIKTISSVSKFMEILDTVSNSLDTNLTTQQMLAFYNVAKDIVKRSLSSDEADIINIQQLYLAGNSQMIYDERMRMVLYNYIPNENSRKDIVQAMKENLELAEHTPITEFSFSINEPYEKEVIGKGPYRTSSLYKLLPSFIGYNEQQARSVASRYGVKVTFEGDKDGVVVSQSYPEAKRIDLINGSVVLTLKSSKTTTVKDDDKKDNKDKDDKKDNEDDNKKPSTDDSDDKTDTLDKDKPSSGEQPDE